MIKEFWPSKQDVLISEQYYYHMHTAVGSRTSSGTVREFTIKPGWPYISGPSNRCALYLIIPISHLSWSATINFSFPAFCIRNFEVQKFFQMFDTAGQLVLQSPPPPSSPSWRPGRRWRQTKNFLQFHSAMAREGDQIPRGRKSSFAHSVR